MKTILYKRNASGAPIFWEIMAATYGTILHIRHGKVGGDHPITDIVSCTMTTVAKEYTSRVNAKRKEGYVELNELHDNTDENKIVDILTYLNTYLPKFNSSTGGAILPMLAKTLETNKPFEKYGTLRGQWKINGLRCEVGVKAEDDNLFKETHLIFQSREGTIWDLPYLEEKLLHYLPDAMVDLMIECNAYIDGEVYYPGLTVNEINHLVKNPTDPRHKDLQLWIYDIAIENTVYTSRRDILLSNLGRFIFDFGSKEAHLNNGSPIVLLPECEVTNFNEAVVKRDSFIDLGFEGLILRNPNAEYGFGKRSVELMYKFKKIEDGKFLIVDIVPEGLKRQDLCKLVLRNDINDEIFECTLNYPHEAQRAILGNKKDYLVNPHYALVEYRERSGINQVPFHAKAVKLL